MLTIFIHILLSLLNFNGFLRTRILNIRSGDTMLEIASKHRPPSVNYRAILEIHNSRSDLPRITDVRRMKVHSKLYIASDNEIQEYWRHKGVRYLPPLHGVTLLEGEPLIVEGSDTVFPVAVRASECFREAGFPGKITVRSTGTFKGLSRLCENAADIAMVSKEVSDSDITNSGCNTNDTYKFHIATDALVIVVNENNALFSSNSSIGMDKLLVLLRDSRDWRDFAKHIGITSPMAGKIVRYFPTKESGTLDFLVETLHRAELNQKKNPAEREQRKADLKKQYLEIADFSKEDYSALADLISKDPGGIGFLGYAHYAGHPEGLRVLKINAVEPNQITVDTARYPLLRPLYFLTTKTRITHSTGLCSFLRDTINRMNNFVSDVGYFAVPTIQQPLAEIERACPDRGN